MNRSNYAKRMEYMPRADIRCWKDSLGPNRITVYRAVEKDGNFCFHTLFILHKNVFISDSVLPYPTDVSVQIQYKIIIFVSDSFLSTTERYEAELKLLKYLASVETIEIK